MPPEEEKVEGQEGQETKIETPAPDPRDEKINQLQTSVHQLSSNLENISLLLQQQSQRGAQQTPALPPLVDLSDDDIDQAIASGQGGAKVMRRLMEVEREKIRREMIVPLQTQGLGAIAALTQKVTLEGQPHYKRFKKEIDSAMNSLPPEMRLNPEVALGIYNTFVGQNYETLRTEERQEWARQANQPKVQTPTPSTRGKQTVEEDEIPEGSEEPLKAIQRDHDEFARRLGQGYKDWKDYVSKTKEFQQ